MRSANISNTLPWSLAALLAAYAFGTTRDGAPEPRVSGAPTAATQPEGSPQDAAPAKAAPTKAAPARMDEAAFWQLTADTRTESGNDTGGSPSCSSSA